MDTPTAQPAQERRTVGRPFARGPDSRRGPGGRKPRDATARALARARRQPVIEALVKLIESNATTKDPELAREVRETAALVLRYSDGEPGAANVPTELDERRAAEGADGAGPDDLDGTEPPAVDGADSAPQEHAA